MFVILLLFALQNQHVITVNGLFGTQASWPLAWILALTLAIGAMLGVLAMLPRALRRKSTQVSSSPKREMSTGQEDHDLGI